MAHWLDTVFHAFDRSIFAGMHRLHNAAGGFFDFFCKFVSFFGKGGWFFILVAFICLFFKASRRRGVGMAFALILGALVTNILLKNIVGRVRPFNADPEFAAWWQAAGSNAEDSYCFPSGHTTAAFAATVALAFLGDKRYAWTGILFACLMGFSRIYLIVHYPTDVIAGLLVGTAAGLSGAALAKLLYRKAGGKFGDVLREWDTVAWLKSRLHRKAAPIVAGGEVTTDTEHMTDTVAEPTATDVTAEDIPTETAADTETQTHDD